MNGKPTPEDQKKNVCLWYDDDKEMDVMVISLPIGQMARADIGTALLRGVLEEMKNVGLNNIKSLRMRNEVREKKIITPAPGAMPNGLKIVGGVQ